MARDKIKVRKGLKSALPNLDVGELGYTLDTNELWIGGNDGTNKKPGKEDIDRIDNELVSVNEQLADIATFVNADRTGVVSASDNINLAISNMKDGDELHFHPGTYI